MISYQEIYDYVVAALNESEFAQGAVVMGLLTAAWQSLKTVPSKVWPRISRLFVYSVTIEQTDVLYKYVSKWLSEKYPDKMRIVEALYRHDDPDGFEDSLPSKVEYRHYSDFVYIRMGLAIIRVEKEREKFDNAANMHNAYLGRLKLSGFFCKGAIDNIIQESLQYDESANLEGITVRSNSGHYWDSTFHPNTKTFDKLFFENKDVLISKIDSFLSSEQWYSDRGIDYKLGIMLEGPPGTGKTECAKMIAKYTDRPLCLVKLTSLSDSQAAHVFSMIPPKSVILIDDIDVGMKGRDDKESGVSLATLLSFLGGATPLHNVIVVITTNRPEILDGALVRKGRIDLRLRLDYAKKKYIAQYIKMFYGLEEDYTDISAKLGKEGLPMVDIQDYCMNNTYPEVIDKINFTS